MKRIFTITTLTMLLIITFANFNSEANIEAIGNETNDSDSRIYNSYPIKNDLTIYSLTEHSSILIGSDGGFSSYSFSGDGSLGNPYLIENLNITSASGNAITISDTTVYFEIKNCYLDSNSNGIVLSDIAPGTAVIEDNIIVDLENDGIKMYNCPSTVIENNTIYNCKERGMNIYLCQNTNFTDNSCYNCGFYILENSLEDYLSYTESNNRVNGQAFGWVVSAYGTGFGAPLYGQIYFINCSTIFLEDTSLSNSTIGFSAIFSSNVIVRDCYFGNQSYYGVNFYHSTDCLVENTIFENNMYSVNVENCNSVTVSFCEIKTSEWGVYAFQSYNTYIHDCKFSETDYEGILIENTDAVTIWYNEFTNCSDNMRLYNAHSSTVRFNTISYSINYGMYIESCSSLDISNNTIYQTNIGIYTYQTSASSFIYNLFQENIQEAIYIDIFCNLNLIYWNTFMDNNIGSPQALDNGNGDLWYNDVSLEGNWWSDYDDSGNYTIAGSANSYDLYPLNEQPVDIIGELTTKLPLLTLTILFLAIPIIAVIRKKSN